MLNHLLSLLFLHSIVHCMSLFGIGKNYVMLCFVLPIFVLFLGVGWRALTCGGVCLNQAGRSLFSRKTMMGQVDTKHTLSEASRMGRYIVPMLLTGGRRRSIRL